MKETSSSEPEQPQSQLPSEPSPKTLPNRRLSWLLRGAAAAVIIVAAASLALSRHTKAAPTALSISPPPSANSSSQDTQTAIQSGDDNQSLQNDLGTISNNLGSEAQQQSNASNATNDDQQEIAVPTN